MPLTPSFSVSQQVGSPSDIVFNDTSTGSDSSLTERRVYLEKHDGQYLVPSGTTTDYIVWPLATNPFTISGILDKDYALNVKVDWICTTPVIPQTNLFVWVESDFSVTGISKVTIWGDRSGNGNDFISDIGKEPELALNVINSLPVIQNATGVVALMSTVANWVAGDCTIILVASQDEASSPLQDIGGAFIASDTDGLYIYRSSSTDTIVAPSGSNLLTQAAINGTFYTIVYTVSGSTRTLTLNDGSTLTDTLAAPGGTGVLNIFDDGFGDYGNKRFAAVIAYSSLLGSTDLSTVKTYLQTKYNHY